MKKLFLTLGLSCMVSFSMAQYVSYSIDNSTGALNNLSTTHLALTTWIGC